MRRGFHHTDGHNLRVEPVRIRFVKGPGRMRGSSCDEHVVAIRKGLAAGKSCAQIGQELGLSKQLVYAFSKRHRMVRNRTRSLRIGGDDGGVIDCPDYRPERIA